MLDESLLSNNISKVEFQQLLNRYDSLIKSISESKGAKSGQKTLLELDHFRYSDAIGLFHSEDARRPMNLDDVKILVEWKLRHGKFRPTLMKLVSSNDEDLVKSTIREAIEEYQVNSDALRAVNMVAKLRGIGPATASLLLSVHDPRHVIFFSDEAFYWLCCDGQKPPIKYNAKEYQELTTAAQTLIERLGVDAVDAERVAYVLMKEGKSEITPVKEKAVPMSDAKSAQVDSMKKSVKRKGGNPTENTDFHAPIRRSKRSKAS